MAQILHACVAKGLNAFHLRGFYPHLQLFDFISRFGVSPLVLRANASDVNSEQQSLLQGQLNTSKADGDSNSEVCVLSDGRKIGIAYFGAQSGPAVFYLHGFPGCRLSGVFFDEPGKKLGARIIAVERPGIGNSSPQPGRRVLDHASDIREIAQQLNLKSYGVIGVSGGGPYALACAYSLPEENLKGVSIVAGMGPIDIGTRGMNWNNWLTFKCFIYFPALMRWLQNKWVTVLRTFSNEKLVDLLNRQYKKPSARLFGPKGKDKEIMSRPGFIITMLNFYREHYKQGVDGHMEEGRVLTSDLGFRLEDIRPSVPTQLWYSRQDTNVPLRMGEAIAARLSCRPDLYILDDETHLSLVLQHSSDALERLLEKM